MLQADEAIWSLHDLCVHVYTQCTCTHKTHFSHGSVSLFTLLWCIGQIY